MMEPVPLALREPKSNALEHRWRGTVNRGPVPVYTMSTGP